MIKYTKDTNNIVTLTLDMGERNVNIINHEKAKAFEVVMDHLKAQKAKHQLKGIIVTSAKKNFLEGGDLDYLYQVNDPQKIYELTQNLKKLYRDLEQPGVPIVAAINGTALGSGFELALACHHRIVLDQQKIRLGHPEVKLGMMPNLGGTIRLMWLLGIEKAFQILTSGQSYPPRGALELGMVDALAKDEKDMMAQAKKWLVENQGQPRPWDDPKRGKIVGGTARESKVARQIQECSAKLIRETNNNYPAPLAILSTLVEGSLVDFDTASRIESRYFASLVCNPISKNMTKAFWYDYNKIKLGLSRPRGFGRFRPRRVGIVGAGKMGSGIAFACLLRGIEVVLKDISKSVAARGREFVENRLEEVVLEGKILPEEKIALLEKMTTTDQSAEFETCDLVIEAVFENKNLKAKVLREAEIHMDEYAFYASNTLSIPITKLAASAARPANFIGLHFFAPADRVHLVEIVKGEATSDETVARAFDFVRAIRKTPIIVKDNWGFYAARVQNTYILEGITMLSEGYSPALIENLGKQAGMSKGVLALADEVSLEIVVKYEEQAAELYGSKYVQHPAVSVCRKMIDELERLGSRKGGGFYEYSEGKSSLWLALTEHFPNTKTSYDRKKLIERLLFAQVIEAVWCLQEKVIGTIAEANLGSVLGWGFPAFKGGALQYIDDYGLQKFVDRCKVFEERYGQRFSVPPLLKRKLKSDQQKMIDLDS